MRTSIVLASLLVTTALGAATLASGTPTALPNSIASTGDSITRAFDVCCFPGFDYPAHSWSTGDDSTDGVTSHYEHVLAKNAAISGHNYNDAKTGAKMVDLNGQVTTAAGTNHAEYITILMGANDVCTSTIAGMTTTANFTSQFQAAINTIKASDPSAVVYVLSIPNVYWLWSLEHNNPSAQSAWKNLKICQSMLSSTNTEAQRQQVLAQENADNAVLASLTAQAGGNFYWDNNATFNYQFTDAQIDHFDYFHPSLAGQNVLSTVSWQSGPYAALAP